MVEKNIFLIIIFTSILFYTIIKELRNNKGHWYGKNKREKKREQPPQAAHKDHQTLHHPSSLIPMKDTI